ncbi:MAG: right-handed parallel beta-helix repeat-containing protein [Saprospiraceae bacterium]|nr:right-handed parallel beta-helix repeat-containing protein [Saprospiraceae bacterium]
MLKYLLGALLALVLITISCERYDDFTTDSSVMLEFSVDTLRFDTVFTEIGSATRLIKVYNRNDRPIRISNISIEGGDATAFRLNVDGIAGNTAQDVEVWANDSIYLFAEVTVDPDQPLSVSPFVIEDKIVFETNGNTQTVNLEAWGQNANYFPSRFNKGVPVVLSCDNGEIVWDDEKPYVVYGEIFIDDCLLKVNPGTRIYVHGGIAQNELLGVFNDGFLYTLENGSLQMLGEKDNPIIIQGDRLEENFQDEEGQWQGIILGKGSKNNRFTYTTIRNANFGLYVDSAAVATLENVDIHNTTSSGIIGFHSTINATNCLVYNNNFTSVNLVFGGDYNFTYCTIASYGVDANALGLSNFFCYDDPFQCQVRQDYRLNATFQNSILFGSKRDQLSFADISGGQPGWFDVWFENCIVRVEDLLEQQDGLYFGFFSDQCKRCINGTRDDILFVDENEDNYRLDSLSIADGAAQANAIQIDIEGTARDPEMPDIGCFERIE